MSEHIVVLIGGDGGRVPIKRTVATHESVLLRDLLDGVECDGSAAKREPEAVHGPLSPSQSVIEVPLPYFSRDILERCCAYMTYRYTQSFPAGMIAQSRSGSTGTSAGSASGTGAGTTSSCVVGRSRREIPRPMTQPLNDYLDAQERHFLSDWDEWVTVNMVKAATLLNSPNLLNISSAKLATYLMTKNIEGIRTLLGVESDFTPQEEAELKKEFQPT